MKLDLFLESVRKGGIDWRMHVLERLGEREIEQAEVVETLSSGLLIEDYPDDTPYSSALFLGFPGGHPLHVVAAFDETNDLVYIITAYEPSEDYFETDYRTRKK